MQKKITYKVFKKGAVLPVRKKPRRLEHAFQRQVAQYLAVALRPPTLWTSIDAGAGKMTKAAAGDRKARGVKPGWADIQVFHPAMVCGAVRTLFIELKVGKGDLSAPQAVFSMSAFAAGIFYFVCRDLEDIHRALEAAHVPVFAKPMTGGGWRVEP